MEGREGTMDMKEETSEGSPGRREARAVGLSLRGKAGQRPGGEWAPSCW